MLFKRLYESIENHLNDQLSIKPEYLQLVELFLEWFLTSGIIIHTRF